MKHPTSPTPSTRSFMSGYSRTTSPLPPPANYKMSCSATTKSYKYLRRFIKFDQMDFEFALWQMLYLFIAPQKVYRNVNYRKQTKSQYARDDPAFLVLFLASLCLTTIGLGYVLNLYRFYQYVYFVLYVIFVDCIFVGVIVATIFWAVANRFFRTNTIDGDIEWGYAFDVHLNAFFPPIIILHCIQLFFYRVIINQNSFFSRFLGNTFWIMAVGYYLYITFLGYNCISHLKHTRLLLAPIPIIFIFYVVINIIGWNATVSVMKFYRNRVL